MPLVLRTNQSLGTAERFANGDGPCGATIEPGVAGRTAFTLRVQTGCSEPCSYCIIPTTRGAPESRPLDSVLTEINRVASAGFKEVAQFRTDFLPWMSEHLFPKDSRKRVFMLLGNLDATLSRTPARLIARKLVLKAVRP